MSRQWWVLTADLSQHKIQIFPSQKFDDEPERTGKMYSAIGKYDKSKRTSSVSVFVILVHNLFKGTFIIN